MTPPAPPEVTLALDVAAVAALGVLVFDPLVVREDDAELAAAIEQATLVLRAAAAPGDAFEATRAMYRRFGIDPTRRRPSSEALLRRIRKGGELPRVNTLVDVCNWCSVEVQLPYGLYDLDRVAGAVEVRMGREGEDYPGIRKDAVHVAGRPVVADRAGAFGNPTSDSARTMVTSDTTRALVVVFAPRDAVRGRLVRVLDLTSERVTRFTGGVERHRAVLGAVPAV